MLSFFFFFKIYFHLEDGELSKNLDNIGVANLSKNPYNIRPKKRIKIFCC